MKTAVLFFASVLGGAHAAALSQPASFEPAGFNATQELERLGVQVEDLPASSLSTRSLEKYACPAAVSWDHPHDDCMKSADPPGSVCR